MVTFFLRNFTKLYIFSLLKIILLNYVLCSIKKWKKVKGYVGILHKFTVFNNIKNFMNVTPDAIKKD